MARIPRVFKSAIVNVLLGEIYPLIQILRSSARSFSTPTNNRQITCNVTIEFSIILAQLDEFEQ